MSKKKNKKNQESYLSIVMLLWIGFGLLLYPYATNLWNEYLNNQYADIYTVNLVKLSEQQKEEMYEEALKYNQDHKQNQVIYEEDAIINSKEHQKYKSQLNMGKNNGVMGTVIIPKIKQKMIIYHGFTDETLEQGCGHIEGTSLPVGGNSTHSVYVAHRGLPDAKLFTDLDQLEEGDLFYFYVLGNYLAYEVDQMKTVLPNEVNNIQIEEGQDLATLVTCTPYAVNSHRLLVRGHRVTCDKEQIEEDNNQIKKSLIEKMVLACVIFFVNILLFIALFIRNIKKRRI
ncbi:sortase A [Granulicatella balaenopterae]|uniref:Sortase A n=1 Tax=Granulicatella balaenopterae TaxID=137733 RepID=A0A1H9IA70_9LACT|nr:class C sortase [Granulicatella balaenopterae]SEQ71418.1 sortase A [Granulicatella balaenopterae]